MMKFTDDNAVQQAVKLPPLMFFAALLMAVFLIATVNPVEADSHLPQFTPGSFAECTGQGWSGLYFGQTTPKDVKSEFDINKHNDIPHSLRLAAPRSANVIVHALFAGKEETSPLAAIYVDYDQRLPYLDAIQTDVADPGTAYYPHTRYEDWWVQVFPKQGIVAYVINPGAPQVEAIMVCPPTAVTNALEDYTTDKPPISKWGDTQQKDPRVMLFGTVDVTSKTTGMDIIEDTQSAIESDLKSDTAGGEIRYWNDGPGSYTVHLSGNYDLNKGGIIDADAKIVGPGPFGTITAEGTGSSDIPANTSDFARYAKDAASTARAKAQSEFADSMKRAGPPKLDVFREQAWSDLSDRLRVTSDAAILETGKAAK